MQIKGLTQAEVLDSRKAHGNNALEPPPRESAWKSLFRKFTDPVIIILLVATAVSAFTNGWVESVGILIAVVLATGISFFSEYRAGRAFDVLNKTEGETPVKVLRDGRMGVCPKTDIVVGDCVFVETGDEIPADGEVLESITCHVDQSKFTGEPEPVLKLPKTAKNYADQPEGAYPPDVMLRGCNVLEGNAHLRVTAVGNATEMGKTIHSASIDTGLTTPLQKQLARLGKAIAVAGISLSVALFVILVCESVWGDHAALTKANVLEFLMVAITLVVVVVPEGLPMSVTMSLAMSMRKMAKNNVLIRKLHACETIGATTVICSDKTGTLTMNQMRVANLVFPYEPLLAEALSVNSTANLDGDKVVGNPTEGALLLALKARNADAEAARAAFKFERQWPFNTAHKWMATCGVSAVWDDKRVLYMKGAPEVLLAASDRIWDADGVHALTAERRAAFVKAFWEEQDKGHRTLGFAVTDRPPEAGADIALGGLVFLGFAGIADPVRPDAPDAVKACRKAGIAVKIVTGDTIATASEIGRQIGLEVDGAKTMDGKGFEALTPEQTLETVKDLRIIARARPNDKMKLVKALQKLGNVVAVTGDGTNDAPALHHADVGIAMGRTGTAVAREAADIILLDDAFPSIVCAVLWGRSLYLNIQRFLVFQMTVNLSAASIAVIGPFVGIPIPLTVIQMLWINLIMDTFAALALASEPPTPEVMDLPPRDPKRFIITGHMAVQIFGVALFTVIAFFAVALIWKRNGLTGRELSMVFCGFVILQFWNLVNVRFFGTARSVFTSNPFRNKVFLCIALGIVAGQFVITQFGGNIFRTKPLNLHDWGQIFLVTSPALLVGEFVRAAHRMFSRRVS